jgi:hypothetical protein
VDNPAASGRQSQLHHIVSNGTEQKAQQLKEF